MPNSLPIIDLAAFDGGDAESRRRLISEVDAACRDIGFLLTRGHAVPDGVIRGMHDISAGFFDQPLDIKRQMEVPAQQDLGWKGQGSSYLAETLTPGADSAKAQDWKESFGIGPIYMPDAPSADEQRYFGKNIYPDAPPGFRDIYEAYYGQMERVAASIMRVFAACLGLDDRYFEDKTDRHISVLAVHHYPAQMTAPAPGQIRAGAHTDFGAITILHTGDNPGGLQVLDKTGEWRDVVPEPDLFIVNLGDLMAQWTNDRWVSTLHRVVNPPRARAHLARQSITFFHQPNWHAPIACLPGCSAPKNPPKYAPTTSGAHLSLKLARLRGMAA
jgi:isopenicillin N synthase-like dioxygenase